MNYPEKFKEGFIKDIKKELNKCEIIYNPKTKGIWFINREEKYWYLEYKIETNYLWWRYEFFNMFKRLFSMPGEVFDDVISRWVEDTLNCKVLSTKEKDFAFETTVEDTLNCKVLTTENCFSNNIFWVEDTLNCKVESVDFGLTQHITVEDTLNIKVDSMWVLADDCEDEVEETLNCKVLSTEFLNGTRNRVVNETLNCKVLLTHNCIDNQMNWVEDTLNLK